jgi:hypothetical protein
LNEQELKSLKRRTTYPPSMKEAGSRSGEGLFAGRPAALLQFHAVRHLIESLGPVTVEATKTQVSFGTARKFAWVWLPQIWIKAQPDSGITLSFARERRVVHEHIRQAVEPYPGWWTHHVVIRQESDLDEDVKAWLSEPYAFGRR